MAATLDFNAGESAMFASKISARKPFQKVVVSKQRWSALSPIANQSLSAPVVMRFLERANCNLEISNPATRVSRGNSMSAKELRA
jgi:hypothetical protein